MSRINYDERLKQVSLSTTHAACHNYRLKMFLSLVRNHDCNITALSNLMDTMVTQHCGSFWIKLSHSACILHHTLHASCTTICMHLAPHSACILHHTLHASCTTICMHLAPPSALQLPPEYSQNNNNKKPAVIAICVYLLCSTCRTVSPVPIWYDSCKQGIHRKWRLDSETLSKHCWSNYCVRWVAICCAQHG